jgi:acyl-CoA thioesterase FadM
MSFLLRFIKVWIQSLAGRRYHSMRAESVVNLRVWPNDLDLNIHVNNGRYLTLMDLGRMDLMFRSGAARLWLMSGLQPLVAFSMCRHFKALKLFQPFQLRSKVLGWDEKWIYFEQRFESKGELYALGVVKGLMAGKKGPLPTSQLMRILAMDEPSPALPAYVADWLASERKAIDMLKNEHAERKLTAPTHRDSTGSDAGASSA